MNVFLTGGTGLIGSAVLRHLVASGHQVTALVRSAESAEQVRAAGATAVIGDLLDTDWVAGQLAEVDGAIHTATPGDDTSAAFDASMANAAVRAFTGTTKPYVHTGGAWVYGEGTELTEDSPLNPPALTTWRLGVESIVLDADLVATVVVPAIVYGNGGGLPNLIARAPRTASGAVTLIGDGSQHWALVHVEDVADLYLLVLAAGESLGRVNAVNVNTPTVRELAEAIGNDVAPESVEASRARLGAGLADALLLDQQFAEGKASILGWTPTGPSLVDEFTTGSYAKAG